MDTKIKTIILDFKQRDIRVCLSNGDFVNITACYEAYEQYGGTLKDKQITLPVAEAFNGWLHGKELPNTYIEQED